MAFSVLMSLYYREQPSYLRQSLDSVFAQTLRPDEVVLVLDGPIGQDLQNVVQEFSRQHPELRVLPLPENRGLGRALNHGLKRCSHDLVARMDTDDIALPDRFETQVKFMENHPEIDAVSGWIEEFVSSDPDNVMSVRKLPETPEEIFEFGKIRNPMNHPTVMFRRNAVLRVGSYQHMYLFEDYHLWIRMMMAGSKLYNLQRPLLKFRTSDQMYERRGGWSYAMTECKLLWGFNRMGYISLIRTLKNIVIRVTVRIMPNKLRAIFYKTFLRR